MACNNCSDTPKSFSTGYYKGSHCEPKGTGDAHDSACIAYLGPILDCVGGATGDSVEVVLQKINAAICNNSSNGYSTYDYKCLTEGGQPINTQGEFVSVISEKVCETSSSLATFLGTTFPEYQTQVTTEISQATSPTVNCTAANVTTNDNLSTILTKYCSTISTLKDSVDLSGVKWDNCLATSAKPVTVKDAFTLVEQQLCTIKNSGSSGALPVFNNIGSCLPAPLTSNDTLYDTVEKIKTRLCQTPIFSTTGLNFGCVTAPSPVTLNGVISNILTEVNNNKKNTIKAVDGGTIAPIDPNNPCLGSKLTITGGGATSDRLVAASDTDNVPGTLATKLGEGDGITIDTITDPSKAVISSDGKVLASDTDSTRGNLVDKITTDSTAPIILSTNLIGSVDDKQVQLTAALNNDIFLEAMFSLIEASPTYRTRFCSLVSDCATASIIYQNPNYYVGPTGQDSATVETQTFYSYSDISVAPLNTGTKLFLDAQCTIPAGNGTYYIFDPGAGSYGGKVLVDGELTATVNIVPVADMTSIRRLVWLQYSSEPTDCLASGTTQIYFAGSNFEGADIYTGYLLGTVAADGAYTSCAGTAITSFKVVAGKGDSPGTICGTTPNCPAHPTEPAWIQ